MAHHSEEVDHIRRRMFDLGATGEYPNGKLNSADEGEIRVAIAADPQKGVVRIDFGKPTAWIAFTPEQAREIADLLTEKAFACRGIRAT